MDMLKKIFAPRTYDVYSCSALLLLRAIFGLAFIFHGLVKIMDPFGWMPEGSGIPGIFQALAAISEFGGGIAIILGLLTPLAALGLAFTMAVATYFHAIAWGDPFVPAPGADGGSYELAAVYFCISLVLMTIGPGCFSADHLIFGKKDNQVQANEQS